MAQIIDSGGEGVAAELKATLSLYSDGCSNRPLLGRTEVIGLLSWKGRYDSVDAR